MKRTTLIGLAGLVLSCSAHAASFGCGKAQTQVEKLICSDVELSSLDDALALAYSAARRLNDNPMAVQKAQKRWLKERDKCSDIACVKTLYASRITSLPLTQAFTVIEDDITSNSPPLKEFCQTMADNLNSMPSWPPAYCERPLNPAFTKLTLPQWREWTVEEFDKRWYLLEQSVNDENSKSIAIARRDERWTDANTKRWREEVRTKESVIEETMLPENTVSGFESRRLLRINSSRSDLDRTKQYRKEKGLKPLDISEYPNECIPGAPIQLTDDGLAVNINARRVSDIAARWQLWLYEFEPGKYKLFDQFWTWVTPGFRTGVLIHDFDMCKILYIKRNAIQGVKK